MNKIAFEASVDKDQAAQNVQLDLYLHCQFLKPGQRDQQ